MNCLEEKFKSLDKELELSDEEWIEKYRKNQELFFKEIERKFYERERAKEIENNEKLMSLVNKDIKFITTFVRKGQSRQDDSKHVFYDVMINENTLPNIVVYDNKIQRNIEKWNKLRGRSLNLSFYASFKQSVQESIYVDKIYIPAIQEAYDKFVQENLRGKETIYQGEKCKAWTIDWFDEVFITDKKIETSFNRWFNKFKENHKINWQYPKEYEPNDREKAWIDYTNLGPREFYIECRRIKYEYNKDLDYFNNVNDYLNEAEKLLHKRI